LLGSIRATGGAKLCVRSMKSVELAAARSINDKKLRTLSSSWALHKMRAATAATRTTDDTSSRARSDNDRPLQLPLLVAFASATGEELNGSVISKLSVWTVHVKAFA